MVDPIVALDDQCKEWDKNACQEQKERGHNLFRELKVSFLDLRRLLRGLLLVMAEILPAIYSFVESQQK